MLKEYTGRLFSTGFELRRIAILVLPYNSAGGNTGQQFRLRKTNASNLDALAELIILIRIGTAGGYFVRVGSHGGIMRKRIPLLCRHRKTAVQCGLKPCCPFLPRCHHQGHQLQRLFRGQQGRFKTGGQIRPSMPSRMIIWMNLPKTSTPSGDGLTDTGTGKRAVSLSTGCRQQSGSGDWNNIL